MLFTTLNEAGSHGHPYRRGVILSELQTPCCPLVSQMILPDPLTLDQISKIQRKLFICVSYSSIIPCLPMLEEYEAKKGSEPNLRPFVNYEGAITLLSFSNLLDENSKIEYSNFVYYTDGSKYLLNEHTATRIIELIRPSMSVIPCENLKIADRTKWSSRKRTRMNEQYESYYYKLLESSDKTNLISARHPALNVEFCSDTAAVDYIGFGQGESLRERAELIRGMVNSTEKDTLRVLHLKTGTPLEVLHAVLLGIDVVVSPFPESQSRAGRAVCFDLPRETETDLDAEGVIALLNESCVFEEGVYRDLIGDTIDFNDSVYRDRVDEPIHETSIAKESRSYVNHLLKSKEMTAYMILSSHNLYMYEALFEKIRDSIENNTLVGFIHNFIKTNQKRHQCIGSYITCYLWTNLLLES